MSLSPTMLGLYNSNDDKFQFISLQSRTYINSASIDTSLTFIPPSIPLQNLDIVDCRNGLLLLKDSSNSSLYVCNPATRKWASVPYPCKEYMELLLAFDPRFSKYYKIISFPLPDSVDEHQWKGEVVEVFSSESKEWTEIHSFSSLYQVYFASSLVAFLNGVFYALDTNYGDVIAVNVEGEACQGINRPDVGLWSLSRQCFGLSRGLLHYASIVVYGEMHVPELHVWVREDCQSSDYTLKHRSSIRAILKMLPFGEVVRDYEVKILAFHPDMEVIFLELQGKLFSYHLVSTELEEICHVQGDNKWFVYTPCYLEDLIL